MPEPADKLQLYHYEGCYFCSLVRDAARDLDVPLELRSIHEDPQYRRDLIEVRGRQTVPVLRIESAGGGVEWLPESRDIVRYLRQRYGDPDQAPSGQERAVGILSRAPWVLLAVGLLTILGRLLFT